MKIKCPNCKAEIKERGSIYCPECGAPLNPPRFEIEGKRIFIIVLFLILFFPLGIIIGLLELLTVRRIRKEWIHEQDMKRLEGHIR